MKIKTVIRSTIQVIVYSMAIATIVYHRFLNIPIGFVIGSFLGGLIIGIVVVTLNAPWSHVRHDYNRYLPVVALFLGFSLFIYIYNWQYSGSRFDTVESIQLLPSTTLYLAGIFLLLALGKKLFKTNKK